MLQVCLDIATIILLIASSGAAFVFYQRITRLRDAIAEAGQVLPKLDHAVAKMNESAAGFSARIQAEIEGVDARIANVKRLVMEMEDRVRDADELAMKLENQLRQARKLDQARARAVPRELAEPKGFAERVEKLAAAALPEPSAIELMEAAVGLPDSAPDDMHAETMPALGVVTHPTMASGASRFATRRKQEEPIRIQETLERIAAMPTMSAFNSFAAGRAE